MSSTALTVSQVARLARCTVRALHHYDELGLLSPSARSASGYRLYDDDDLARLREILLLRQLGVGLDAIAEMLRAAPAERRAALVRQRERLLAQRAQTDAVLRALDATLASLEGVPTMSPEQTLSDVTQFDHAAHADEARERWGDTDAYRESARRTRTYDRATWDAIKAEHGQIVLDLAALLRAGAPADGAPAMDAAEAARRHIDRWFYPCPPAMHAQLGEMYVADPRFAAFYEQVAPGLAAYVRDAIRANAARHDQ